MTGLADQNPSSRPQAWARLTAATAQLAAAWAEFKLALDAWRSA